MKRAYAATVILLAGFVCCSCRGKSYWELVKTDEALQLSSYPFSPDTALSRREVTAPPFLLRLLMRSDCTESYGAYELSAADRALLDQCIGSQPRMYREIMTARLAAICFVRNFTGAGMTLPVYDESGGIWIVLILNPDLFQKTASEWMSYREASSFRKNSDAAAIRVDCGNAPALLPIMLHECSHIFDFYSHITPYLMMPHKERYHLADTSDYISGVWESFDRPAKQYDFIERKSLRPYNLGGESDTEISLAAKTYRELEDTPFVSLYGSLRWPDDFAESFCWYAMTQRLHLPYRILVSENERTVLEYSPMDNPMVRKRWDYFEKIR